MLCKIITCRWNHKDEERSIRITNTVQLVNSGNPLNATATHFDLPPLMLHDHISKKT